MAAILPDSRTSRERKSTVLIVEDEALVRLAISGWLQDQGFETVEAKTAGEAIKSIEKSDTIDIVFSDVGKSGTVDGCTIAQWIRSNRPRLPIVLTSTFAEKAAGGGLRANEQFVSKPYDVREVVAKIRNAISARKLRGLPGAP
jgi:two-component system, response regulator PdtaR